MSSKSLPEHIDTEPVYLTAYERRALAWAISAAPWRFFNPGPATDSALISAMSKLRGGHPSHRRPDAGVDNLRVEVAISIRRGERLS